METFEEHPIPMAIFTTGNLNTHGKRHGHGHCNAEYLSKTQELKMVELNQDTAMI